MNIVKKLFLRYAIALIFIFVLIAFMFLGAYLFVESSKSNAPNIIAGSARFSLSIRNQYFAGEIIVRDRYTWPGGAFTLRLAINATVNSLYAAQNALLYGSTEMGTEGGLGLDPKQQELHYERPCTFPPSITSDGTVCRGLNSLFYRYLDDVYQLSNMNTTDLTFNNTYYQNVEFLATKSELFDWLSESIDLMVETAQTLTNRVDIIGAVLFSVSFPMIIIAYLLLRPLEIRIKVTIICYYKLN